MRVFIETAFSGILRGKLLLVQPLKDSYTSDRPNLMAQVKVTSRNGRAYQTGSTYVFPLDNVTPADCFRIARMRGSGKLFLRCTKTHSRAELFAPYHEVTP